ncbi:Serine acetyltransferase [Parafannyhessea umbonata]|uniref:Serine acetyltransferase n=2 Tax=Parafannyhessea umbonata TaxID=604330 RepID=A0A1H9NH72_9ACTN|nr:Serine acetyltransferase [Parafannyhessea umbonata]
MAMKLTRAYLKPLITRSNKHMLDSSKVLQIRHKINHRESTKIGRLLLNRKYNSLCIKYGCFLPLSARIGKNITFPHGLFGIFISQKAIIGDNCCIFQHVTIGSNNLNGSQGAGAPTIGDNVYIGAGAKIIGRCSIGDNVRIGANAVVTKDVPDNVTVVGQGLRIIQHSSTLDNTFIPI